MWFSREPGVAQQSSSNRLHGRHASVESVLPETTRHPSEGCSEPAFPTDPVLLTNVLDPEYQMLLSEAERAAVLRSTTELPGESVDLVRHDVTKNWHFECPCFEAKLIRSYLKARCD